jgi:hypothetical protein
MPDVPITLADMIEEVTDELNYRERAFTRRMRDAGMALQNQLQRRIEIMRAIKRHLEAERDRR